MRVFVSECVFIPLSRPSPPQNFLPWVTDSRITARMPYKCTAELEVGFTAFTERYTSHVSFEKPTVIKVCCMF